MKINKLTASFGKLENETLSLHDGLNVIYAPNESGKSTWCAFILAMLYGIDTGERARAGYLPDKLRYAPWSGAPMEGTMDLTADRCDITISRSTRTKSAPMREFSATYTGTATPVKGLTGTTAGEALTGVSKDVFRRSAFIAQGTIAVTGSPELERRINSIVSTGEEQTSYSEADARLRAWQRKRRYNRRGILPELETRIDDTQRKLEDMGGSLQDIEALEKQLEQERQECRRLELAVNESRRLQRREALNRLNEGRGRMQQCSDSHDRAMEELSIKREALRGGRFGSTAPEEFEKEFLADSDTINALRSESKKKANPLFMVLLLLLSAAGAALYIHFQSVFYMVFSLLACAAAIVMLVRYSRIKQASLKAYEERKALLRKYGVSSSKDLGGVLAAHKALWDAVRQAEENERQTRGEYEDALAELKDLENAALQELDFTGGSSEAARLGRELANARANVEKLSAHIASLNGRLAMIGDPLVLSSNLSCMRDDYEDISFEYDALSLAIDTLHEADSEIQSRFSPELGRIAAGYMSTVTDGRYADILLNRDFTASAKTQNDPVARPAEYLSAGTMDLMYLAVRLAVCELAMPKDEPCPLIIDDALVNLDNTRLEQAMKLLKEIARSRQVILFTCRK